MLSLVSLPDPTVVIASSSEWGNVMFAEFWPWTLAGLGIFIAVALILWLSNTITDSVHHLTTRKYEDTSEYEYRKKHHMTEFD